MACRCGAPVTVGSLTTRSLWVPFRTMAPQRVPGAKSAPPGLPRPEAHTSHAARSAAWSRRPSRGAMTRPPTRRPRPAVFGNVGTMRSAGVRMMTGTRESANAQKKSPGGRAGGCRAGAGELGPGGTAGHCNVAASVYNHTFGWRPYPRATCPKQSWRPRRSPSPPIAST
jgi:hypothetical protein